MIRLLGAELNRLRSRRFTLIALLGVLAVLALYQLIVNYSLTPPTAAEQASQQAQFQQAHKDWVDNHAQYEADCRASAPPGTDCTNPEPKPSDFSTTTTFDDAAQGALQVSTYVVALVVFMVSGSFVAAEFASGSIANWLTFVPRRGRVFTSKLVVITVFGVVLSAVAATLTLTAAAVIAAVHGAEIAGVARLIAFAARGLAAAGILAVVGFCIGLVARHTAAAVGVLLGYFVVFFVRRAILGEMAWAQRLTRWSPEGNLFAVVQNGYHYEVPKVTVTAEGRQYEFVTQTISATHGAIYWAVLLAVVVAGSWLVFGRRDVN